MSYEDNMKTLGPDEIDILYDRIKASHALQERAKQEIFAELQENLGDLQQADLDPQSGFRSLRRTLAVSEEYLEKLSSGALSSDDLELVEVDVTVGSEIQPGVAYYDLIWDGTFTFKSYDLPPVFERKGNVFFYTFEGEDIVEIFGDELFVFEDQDSEPDDLHSEE